MHASHIIVADAAARKAPDHALIAAAAAVRQARTRTARAAAALDRPQAASAPSSRLVALLRGDRPGTRGGSFHPGLATER